MSSTIRRGSREGWLTTPSGTFATSAVSTHSRTRRIRHHLRVERHFDRAFRFGSRVVRLRPRWFPFPRVVVRSSRRPSLSPRHDARLTRTHSAVTKRWSADRKIVPRERPIIPLSCTLIRRRRKSYCVTLAPWSCCRETWLGNDAVLVSFKLAWEDVNDGCVASRARRSPCHAASTANHGTRVGQGTTGYAQAIERTDTHCRPPTYRGALTFSRAPRIDRRNRSLA